MGVSRMHLSGLSLSSLSVRQALLLLHPQQGCPLMSIGSFFSVAHQAPLSMGFPRQEHWRGLPFPSPIQVYLIWVWTCGYICISSVQFIHSVVSDSLGPHGLQHTRPPCPSPTPGVYPDSVGDAIQPSNPLSSPSAPAFNLSQYQGLFQ